MIVSSVNFSGTGGKSTCFTRIPSGSKGKPFYRIFVEIRSVADEFLGSFVMTVTVLLWRPFFPVESKTTLMGAVSPGAITFLEGETAVHPQEDLTLRINSSLLPPFFSSKVYSFLSPCLMSPKSQERVLKRATGALANSAALSEEKSSSMVALTPMEFL